MGGNPSMSTPYYFKYEQHPGSQVNFGTRLPTALDFPHEHRQSPTSVIPPLPKLAGYTPSTLTPHPAIPHSSCGVLVVTPMCTGRNTTSPPSVTYGDRHRRCSTSPTGIRDDTLGSSAFSNSHPS